MRADQISDLAVFADILAAGSLSAAARATGSSPAAMSRRLAALEARLGVRLVVRNSRSFRPTDEGRRFHEHCLRILGDIRDAEAEVAWNAQAPRGSLRVSAPLGLGRRRIAPLVGRFAAKYPDITVHLTLSDAGPDVIDDELDVALRVGLPESLSLVGRKLLSTRRIVCAAPSYLEKRGRPETPEDLARHDCIRLVRGQMLMDRWAFRYGNEVREVRVDGRLSSTSGEVVREWALNGMGLALKAVWDIEHDLAAGRLVECLGEHWCDTINLYAIFASRRHLPPRLRAFLDFIRTDVGTHQEAES